MKAKRKYLAVTLLPVILGISVFLFLFSTQKPAPVNILCLGDSLTASSYGTYTRTLEARLRKKNSRYRVLHAARPGNTSGEYLEFLKTSPIVTKASPRAVILLLGTNDVRTDSDRTNLNVFRQNMADIIALVTRHRNKKDNSRPILFLATVPPIFNSDLRVFNNQSAQRIEKEINPAIRQMAADLQLPVIDLNRFFRARPQLIPGVHPSKKGYSAMAGFIAEQINRFLQPRAAADKERLPNIFSGTIAFESDRTGNHDIFLINRQGLFQLTRSPAYDGYPCFSPDGNQIVFESDRSGKFEIYVTHRKGQARRLFQSPTRDRSPFWTADGKYIYFDRKVKGKEQIFRFHIAENRVEPVFSLPGRNGLPAVSPDSSHMLVTSNRFMGWNILQVDLTSGKATVFSPEYAGCRPKFSHSGEQVAFVSHKFDHRGDIILTAASTFTPERLTHDELLHDYFPAFSPNDRHIVYASGPSLKSGNYDIRIMEISSRKIWTITSSPAMDYKPCWSRK